MLMSFSRSFNPFCSLLIVVIEIIHKPMRHTFLLLFFSLYECVMNYYSHYYECITFIKTLIFAFFFFFFWLYHMACVILVP